MFGLASVLKHRLDQVVSWMVLEPKVIDNITGDLTFLTGVGTSAGHSFRPFQTIQAGRPPPIGWDTPVCRNLPKDSTDPHVNVS